MGGEPGDQGLGGAPIKELRRRHALYQRSPRLVQCRRIQSPGNSQRSVRFEEAVTAKKKSFIRSSQSHFKATLRRSRVMARTFSLPASIFCTVRGLTPTLSARRSWLSFLATRRLRTLHPIPANWTNPEPELKPPYRISSSRPEGTIGPEG